MSSFSFYINFLNAALDSAGTAQELFETENDLQKIYYMMMMTVDSSYRGRGIASQMITSCFEVNRESRSLNVKISLSHKYAVK